MKDKEMNNNKQNPELIQTLFKLINEKFGNKTVVSLKDFNDGDYTEKDYNISGIIICIEYMNNIGNLDTLEICMTSHNTIKIFLRNTVMATLYLSIVDLDFIMKYLENYFNNLTYYIQKINKSQ